MDPKRNARPASRDDSIVDFILEASEEELNEALAACGYHSGELAQSAELAIDRAFARATAAAEVAQALSKHPSGVLHQGLSALIRLLMRRDDISHHQLAYAAEIDVEELVRIVEDANYTPSPRTVFRLEDHFRLPARTLVLLSGSVDRRTPDFEQVVLRFAAHSKQMGALSREEKRDLNKFIRFLADQTDR